MKIHYPHAPKHEDLKNGKHILTADFHFWVDHQHYVIRKGFVWDGASIPKLVQWKYGTPFDPVHLVGGLVHDAIYANKVEYHGDYTNSAHYAAYPSPAGFTRLEADNIYYLLIRRSGAVMLRAFKEWAAVRIFGRSHWTKR